VTPPYPCKPAISSYVSQGQRRWLVTCRRHLRTFHTHTWPEAVRRAQAHQELWSLGALATP
jgi:hypothetical protein